MLTVASATAILASTKTLQYDPINVLLKLTPVIAAIQLVESFIVSKDIFSAFLSLVLSTALTPCVALIFVLFGAPATDYISGTLLCAANVTLLAVVPMISKYGLEYSHWKNAAALALPFTDIYGGFLVGILGAWLGAIPIALDWDRPWQQWPITVLLGSAAGTLIGNLVGLIVSNGKNDKYGLERQQKLDKKLQKKRLEQQKQQQQQQQQGSKKK